MGTLRIIFLAVVTAVFVVACATDDKPISSAVPAQTGPHWSYSGTTGPNHWAELSPDWNLASEGRQQSPIDIREARLTTTLYPLNLSYEAAPVRLHNNGHTIQHLHPAGSRLRVGEQEFMLKQIHFHARSEHKVNGKTFPLEMHMVHQAGSGTLLVVAVLFEVGQENAFLSRLWQKLPTSPGTVVEGTGMIIDPENALPIDRAYYFYQGSLTTPPCTEGVQWYVMRQPVQLSRAQLESFTQIYSGNFRPAQPLFGRTVWARN